MQGRVDYPVWVTSIKVAYSMNGKTWDYVENGKVFPANSDTTTKVKITFSEPVYARAIRIYPQTWTGLMSMRFDAIYVDI